MELSPLTFTTSNVNLDIHEKIMFTQRRICCGGMLLHISG